MLKPKKEDMIILLLGAHGTQRPGILGKTGASMQVWESEWRTFAVERGRVHALQVAG